MSNAFEFVAELRQELGKAAVRRMRHDDRIPATIYGAGKEPQSITLSHKDTLHALGNEAVYSHILAIKLNGESQQVVLKNIQRHPSKPKLLHIDFLRVKAKEKITMQVPLHFIGGDVAPGVKAGGVLSKISTELEIRCLPGNLPEFIELDVSELELDNSLHLSDIKLPSGVELATEIDEEHDQPIVSAHVPRVAKEESEEEADGEEGAEGEAADADSEPSADAAEDAAKQE